MKTAPLPLWRLSRARYDRMVDAGILGEDDKVEAPRARIRGGTLLP